MSRRSMIAKFRKPRDARELIDTLMLFLEDAFYLGGSSCRGEWGGDVQVDLRDGPVDVIVTHSHRDDGMRWVLLSESEAVALKAYIAEHGSDVPASFSRAFLHQD